MALTPRSYTISLVHYVDRLGTSNVELQVHILLPVAEEERKLLEKGIVYLSNELDCSWMGIARNTSFEVTCAMDKSLPAVVNVLVFYLHTVSARYDTRV